MQSQEIRKPELRWLRNVWGYPSDPSDQSLQKLPLDNYSLCCLDVKWFSANCEVSSLSFLPAPRSPGPPVEVGSWAWAGSWLSPVSWLLDNVPPPPPPSSPLPPLTCQSQTVNWPGPDTDETRNSKISDTHVIKLSLCRDADGYIDLWVSELTSKKC